MVPLIYIKIRQNLFMIIQVREMVTFRGIMTKRRSGGDFGVHSV